MILKKIVISTSISVAAKCEKKTTQAAGPIDAHFLPQPNFLCGSPK